MVISFIKRENLSQPAWQCVKMIIIILLLPTTVKKPLLSTKKLLKYNTKNF